MKQYTLVSSPVLTGLVVALFAGCDPVGQGGVSETPVVAIPEAEAVLATVNGVPIGEQDVYNVLRAGGHDKGITAQKRDNVLERLIREELVRQRAVELGLDRDPSFVERVRPARAQLAGIERDELGELFYVREIEGRATVGEEEARAWFAEHEAEIRADLHIQQILKKDRAEIDRIAAELQAGADFEELAAAQYPGNPALTRRLWDKGSMRWSQVPEAWSEVVYDLQVGDVSGIIEGPGNRFWIVRLADRREDPAVTFEDVRPMLEEQLTAIAIEELRDQTEEELLTSAAIERFEAPPIDPNAEE